MTEPAGSGSAGARRLRSRATLGGDDEGVVNHSISMPTRRPLVSGNERSSMKLLAVRAVRVRVGDGMV
jgi:hypothetical protein